MKLTLWPLKGFRTLLKQHSTAGHLCRNVSKLTFSRAELPAAISDQTKLQQSWNSFFQDFILEHYSEDGADYENAIAEFMDIRQAMRTPTRDANGISLLFEHFNQLYFVERRFFPPDRSLGIYFEW